jgi:hypothetical protein
LIKALFAQGLYFVFQPFQPCFNLPQPDRRKLSLSNFSQLAEVIATTPFLSKIVSLRRR